MFFFFFITNGYPNPNPKWGDKKGKETNIAEVESIVIKIMHNSKSSELSPDATGKDENHLNCDQWEFKSKNKDDMIAHIIIIIRHCLISGGCLIDQAHARSK